MNLYLVSQREYNGYDTYDAIIVAAINKKRARLVKPLADSWASKLDSLVVECIGRSNSRTEKIVLQSFNAG